MEKADVAGAKKKARREGRTIIFVDESGLSTRPHRVRTWAPRGCTPVLQETFNWDKLSLIAGLSIQRFYFRIYEGSINGERAAEFLGALLRHVRGKLLVIWDGAAIHRSQPVKELLAASAGRLWLERLPAYAPELNPVEYLWAHLKQHEIANLLARDGWELGLHATRALRNMRRRPRIIRACWVQSELCL
jgi:transposase